MSAESYAEQQFTAACRDPRFLARLAGFGGPDAVRVVADSTPVGEAVAQAGSSGVLAVLDEDADHGFMLVRVRVES